MLVRNGHFLVQIMGIAFGRQRLKPFLMAPSAAAAMTCLLGNPAGAQPVAGTEAPVEQGTGLYATLGAGGGWPQSQSTTYVDPLNGRYVYNGGFAGDVGIGYDFGSLRLEATYAFNSNPNSKLDFDGGSLAIDGTQVRLNSGYVSAYWDIPITPRIIPYIGGGVGGTNYSYGAGTIDSVPYKANGIGTFGYQAKVGVTYVVSRRADLFVEGTYQGASGFKFASECYGPLNVWGAKGGVRWRFGGAPAPVAFAPVPEPAPAPAPAPIPEPEPAPAPVRGLW
jgi:opacity protein-like surface antigen